MFNKIDRKDKRSVRHLRLRNRLTGTTERPRLAVFRSLSHIYAQIIDDQKGCTIVAASSIDPNLKAKVGNKGGSIIGAEAVGSAIAEKALEKGIKQVVFDRGGNIYHGRIAALAEAARKAGLEF